MAFADYVKAVARGGLPAILDDPSIKGTVQRNPEPEKTPPAATVQDREPFLAGIDGNTRTLAISVGIGVAGLVVLLIAYRAFAK